MISTEQTGKLSAALEQELSHCRVLGQANRPVESIRSLRCFPEPLQAEMATLLETTKWDISTKSWTWVLSMLAERFVSRPSVPVST